VGADLPDPEIALVVVVHLVREGEDRAPPAGEYGADGDRAGRLAGPVGGQDEHVVDLGLQAVGRRGCGQALGRLGRVGLDRQRDAGDPLHAAQLPPPGGQQVRQVGGGRHAVQDEPVAHAEVRPARGAHDVVAVALRHRRDPGPDQSVAALADQRHPRRHGGIVADPRAGAPVTPLH